MLPACLLQMIVTTLDTSFKMVVNNYVMPFSIALVPRIEQTVPFSEKRSAAVIAKLVNITVE